MMCYNRSVGRWNDESKGNNKQEYAYVDGQEKFLEDILLRAHNWRDGNGGYVCDVACRHCCCVC